MNKFKNGDKVICINNEYNEELISINQIYTIKKYDKFREQYELEEIPFYTWRESRFIKANSFIIKNKLGIK